MNSDEVVSHISSIVLALGAAYLGNHGVSTADAQTLLGAAVTLGAGAFKLYSHWNMVKVPETTVLPK